MKIGIPFTYVGEIGSATIQWFLNDVALADGVTANGTVSGATTDSLLIDTEVPAEWFGTYHATVTDESGCAVTTADVVFGCDIEITTQPEHQSVTLGMGEAFELSFAYEGNIGQVDIQWYLDGVALTDGIFAGEGGNYSVAGATSTTLTIVNTPSFVLGEYHAVVIDPLTGCEVSTDVVLVGTLQVQGYTAHTTVLFGSPARILYDGTLGYEYITYQEVAEPAVAGKTPSHAVMPAILEALGHTAPMTWAVQSGSIPPGLSLESTTDTECRIQGIPTTLGEYNFVVRATAPNGAYVERVCVISIYNPRIIDDKAVFESTWTGGALLPDVMLATGSSENGEAFASVHGAALDYQNLGVAYQQRFGCFLHPISTPPGTGNVVFGVYGPIPSEGDKFAFASEGYFQWLNSGPGFDGSYDLVFTGGVPPPEWHGAPDPTTISEDV